MAERGRLCKTDLGLHIETKSKILVVGSSHARRMFDHMKNSAQYSEYELDHMTMPGADMARLATHWPHDKVAQMSSHDVLIIQALGNDLFRKGTHFITRNPKKIHLRSFDPTAHDEFAKSCLILESLIKGIAPKILILDNVFRHLCGCPEHQYPGLISHQVQANKILRRTLRSSARVVSTDTLIAEEGTHRKISVGDRANWLIDAVHLKPVFYQRVIERLLPMLH